MVVQLLMLSTSVNDNQKTIDVISASNLFCPLLWWWCRCLCSLLESWHFHASIFLCWVPNSERKDRHPLPVRKARKMTTFLWVCAVYARRSSRLAFLSLAFKTLDLHYSKINLFCSTWNLERTDLLYICLCIMFKLLLSISLHYAA